MNTRTYGPGRQCRANKLPPFLIYADKLPPVHSSKETCRIQSTIYTPYPEVSGTYKHATTV